ncbi:MAG: hypothetical protein E6719_00740, partial [Dermabacter sp.]|nr:hypothetical protein [Dermabacter sp.]
MGPTSLRNGIGPRDQGQIGRPDDVTAGEHLGHLGWARKIVHHGAGASVGDDLVLIDDQHPI